MTTGVLARSLYLVSWSEACRHVISYWIFVLSLILVMDILMLPLLESGNVIIMSSYVLLRSLVYIILSVEAIASRIAYRLRINLDAIHVLKDSEEYIRLTSALTLSSIIIMLVLMSIVLTFSNVFHGVVAADLILMGIVLLNVALSAILIRPKCLAFVASASASLAVIYVLLIPILYGEFTASMMAIALVCSDALAILGLNVAGVPTCLDATRSSES